VTPESRVGALQILLERVQKNARAPRPPFLSATDLPRDEVERAVETKRRAEIPEPVKSPLQALRRPTAPEPRDGFIAEAPIANGGKPPTISFARPEDRSADEAPESMAFDLVQAPRTPSTLGYSERAGDDDGPISERAPIATHDSEAERAGAFGDETTATANVDEVEELLLQEQQEAAKKQIRFEESPPTKPPAEQPPLTPAQAEPISDEPDLLVIDDFELDEIDRRSIAEADAEAEAEAEADERERGEAGVTEPPTAAAVPMIPPEALEPAAVPDIDDIEAAGPIEAMPEIDADAVEPPTEHSRVEFVEEPTHDRLKSTPPPDVDDEGAPSSVRKPREGERPIDDRFDGFEQPASEPPESGEVPSQGRPSAPDDHALPDALVGALDSHGAPDSEIETSGVPTPRRPDEQRGAPEMVRADSGVESPALIDLDSEFDHDETKEVRALGRVDVVERPAPPPAAEVVVLKSAPRAVENFGSILDEALAIGETHI
jgi:hypothetical protein